jgi:hypothetical protein
MPYRGLRQAASQSRYSSKSGNPMVATSVINPAETIQSVRCTVAPFFHCNFGQRPVT